MHRKLFSTVVAAMFVAIALSVSVASADPVRKRVELSAETVAKDSSWAKMAKRIGLPFENLFVDTDGDPCGTVANLPVPSVGRMYGGSWGASGSELMLRAGGWQLWRQTECPGVLGVAPNGVIVHAELGDNGTKFLYVGTNTGAAPTTTEASDLAGQLNNAIENPDSADWQAFDQAVAQTTTGIKVDLMLKKMRLHYDPESGTLKKGVAKTATEAGDKPAGKDSKRMGFWLTIAVFAGLLILGAVLLWLGAKTAKLWMKILLMGLGLVLVAYAFFVFFS